MALGLRSPVLGRCTLNAPSLAVRHSSRPILPPFQPHVFSSKSQHAHVKCSSHCSHQQHGRTLICCATAAAQAALPHSVLHREQPRQHDVVKLLRVCQTAFLCMAGCAAWAYFSAGNAAWGPLASMSIAVGETSATGLRLAVKSGWAGLLAGFFHTLCGPDHLAGLTPLSIGRTRVGACALGALWGFGHSTGQLILGLIFILLKERFQDLMPALSKWSSTVVPLVLITIGLLGIYENYFSKDHEAQPQLEGAMHGQIDGGASNAALAGALAKDSEKPPLKAGLTTYATGIVHGLSPDALFVVIPALALPSRAAAFAYCVMFVVGTVVTMGGYTLLIGETSQALIREKPWLQSHLSTLACGFAIVMGLIMLLPGFGFEVPFLA